MNLPSVKTLEPITRDREAAKKVRRLLEGIRLGPITTALMRIDQEDLIPRGYGVETIRRGEGKKSPGIHYINRGDPYVSTLMYIEGLGFRVGCWGDIVERGKYK